MPFWIQFFITISIFALMLLSGYYTYRYLNKKILNSSTLPGLAIYALLLIISLGAIYSCGLFLMAFIYKFITK
jgi:hypothetical protein